MAQEGDQDGSIMRSRWLKRRRLRCLKEATNMTQEGDQDGSRRQPSWLKKATMMAQECDQDGLREGD